MTSAGLVLASTLALGDLLLILLVARRVRQLGQRLSGPAPLGWNPVGTSRPWLKAGTKIPAFEAVTVSQEPISLEQLLGQRSMVGFFSSGCEPCRQQLPLFARLFRDAGARRAVAVVVGPASKSGELLAMADGTMDVVREEQGGPVTTAFSASAFPGIFLLDPEARVIASGPSVMAVIGTKPDVAAARQ